MDWTWTNKEQVLWNIDAILWVAGGICMFIPYAQPAGVVLWVYAFIILVLNGILTWSK